MVETQFKIGTAQNYDSKTPHQDPDVKYFEPTTQKALIIYNTKYDKVRKDKKEVEDYTDSQQNAMMFKKFLTDDCKIDESQIMMLPDVTADQMEQIMFDLKKEFREYHTEALPGKLCVWVYYTGHGIMSNTSHILLNEEINHERYFTLEKWLLSMSSCFRNTCVLGIYDCSREYIRPEAMRDFNPSALDAFIKPEDKSTYFQNIVNCYGTGPNSEILLSSAFTEKVVRCLRDSMKANDDVIILPRALQQITLYQRQAQFSSSCCDTIWIDTNNPAPVIPEFALTKPTLKKKFSETKPEQCEPQDADVQPFVTPTGDQPSDQKIIETIDQAIKANTETQEPVIQIIAWDMNCPQRPDGNIQMNWTIDYCGVHQVQEIFLKQGCEKQIHMTFLVLNAPIEGLRLVNDLYCDGVLLNHAETPIVSGNFAPSNFPYEWVTPYNIIPTFNCRRTFVHKGRMVGQTGRVFLRYERAETIDVNWH